MKFHAPFFALLLALLLIAPPLFGHEGRPRAIVVLHQVGREGQEAALLDALRIYTRDLDRPIQQGGPAPLSAEHAALDSAANEAREAQAEVVAWFGVDESVPVLFALRVDSGSLRSTPLADAESDVVAQTLALKIRALLGREPPVGRGDWKEVPVPSPMPVSSPPSAPISPLVGAPGAPIVAAPSPVIVAATPPVAPKTPPAGDADEPDKTTVTVEKTGVSSAPRTSRPGLSGPKTRPSVAPKKDPHDGPQDVAASRAPRRPARLEIGVGYGFDLPTDPAWLRHGLALRVAVKLGRLPLAVELDSAITTRPSVNPPAPMGSHVTILDVPIGLAVTARLDRPRYLLSAGPRASLQIINADATSADGRSGSHRLYSAGLGAMGQVRWFATDFLSLALTITAEALVPQQQFTVDGRPGADLGSFQFGANAGLIFRLF